LSKNVEKILSVVKGGATNLKVGVRVNTVNTLKFEKGVGCMTPLSPYGGATPGGDPKEPPKKSEFIEKNVVQQFVRFGWHRAIHCRNTNY